MIAAHFSDTTSSTGSLLIGADGVHSITRSLLSHPLAPSITSNTPLPIRLLGVSVLYARPLAEKLRALDPFFFQGGDPATNAFMYYSFLDTPSNNTRPGPLHDTYECQIIISWPFRPGFLDEEQPIEVPNSHTDRIKLMQRIAARWAEPFRECVLSIPSDTEVKTIRLEDWVPRPGIWSHAKGKATLVGDAAHAMTMYRGEAANHGILDVSVLLEHILPSLPMNNPEPYEEGHALAAALTAYETEMIERTAPAVLTSRRACMDAHQYAKIGDQSPLVSKRAVVVEE